MISVVVSNYNCGRYLPEAIRSILSQEAKPLEIVVADDGSTDDSPSRAQPYLNQVRWLGLANGGQAAALNAALECCHGDWVAFLESDDLWLSEKLKTVLSRLQDDPELVAVQHSMTQVDAELKPLPTWLPQESHRWALEDFLKGKTLLSGLSGLAVRRDILERTLPFPKDLITCLDEYLQPRLLLYGPIQHLREPLGLRRVHGANFYARIREDPKRLEPYLALRSVLERHQERFLQERGLRLAPALERRQAVERLQLELFLYRWREEWAKTLKTWGRILTLCGLRPYSLFKGVTLAAALASPRLYLYLYQNYERWKWLPRLRNKLFP